MRAVTISIGRWHVILAAGKVANVQLQAAKPKLPPTPIRLEPSNTGDNHLFIRGVHEPNLCPECVRPGSLSEARP